MSPDIAGKLMRDLQHKRDLPPTEEPLTRRELEVLRLVARGLKNQEIAETLMIGVGTVRTHVSNILAKLHLANRTQAALYALREGFAPLDK
jgi:NarL family two-component system response regulator LiaR